MDGEALSGRLRRAAELFFARSVEACMTRATILQSEDGSGKVLGAILLNPPTTKGPATLRHVSAAAAALDCRSFAI